MTRRNWTREELFQALRLYFETPFGRLDQRNPEIVALAVRLQRTPSAVAMKLSNLASIDPVVRESGRVGLTGASSADRAAWADFTSSWAAAVAETEPAEASIVVQTEMIAEGKRRIGQPFFRRAVLSNFDSRCCATGIAEPRLLIASHIAAWADDADNRLNPANGLCLAATIDRAFDAGMLTVDERMCWLVSEALRDHRDPTTQALFAPLAGQQVRQPVKIRLSEAMLARHRTLAMQEFAYG